MTDDATSRAVFEWGRVQSPLDVLLPGLVAALVLAFAGTCIAR